MRLRGDRGINPCRKPELEDPSVVFGQIHCLGEWSRWLERKRPTDGSWVFAQSLGGGLKCASASIVINGGATFHQIDDVSDCSFISNCPDTFAVSPVAGEYRVVWGNDVVNSSGQPLQQQLTSNTFTLVTTSP
jgi:hypothetical protein